MMTFTKFMCCITYYTVLCSTVHNCFHSSLEMLTAKGDGICDLLSENLAHPAFYENQDKTRNRYTDV